MGALPVLPQCYFAELGEMHCQEIFNKLGALEDVAAVQRVLGSFGAWQAELRATARPMATSICVEAYFDDSPVFLCHYSRMMRAGLAWERIHRPPALTRA